MLTYLAVQSQSGLIIDCIMQYLCDWGGMVMKWN